MPEELVLHIGYYKTGSTALQNRLGANRERLLEGGTLYPHAGSPGPRHANQSAVSFQLYEEHGLPVPAWYRGTKRYEEITGGAAPPPNDELVAEVRATDASRVVISSEELVRFGDGAPPGVGRELLAALGVSSTTVVCYVRRPDRYLQSWYNQRVKLGESTRRLSESVGEYLGTVHTDYDRMIGYWAHDVGCDRLVVRDYDHLDSGDVVADFAAATGLELPDGDDDDAEEGATNPSLDGNFIEYARLFSLYRKDTPPGRLNRILREMANDDRVPPRGPVTMLDGPARKQLYEHCAPMSERLGRLVGLGRTFFDDLDEMLEIPEGAVSDVDAFREWAPYLDAVLRGALRN